MLQRNLSMISLVAVIALVAFLNRDYLSSIFFSASNAAVQDNNAQQPALASSNQANKSIETPRQSSSKLDRINRNKMAKSSSASQQSLSHLPHSPAFIETAEYANLSNEEKLIVLKKLLNDEPVDQVRVLLVPDKETTIASASQGRITYLASKLGEHFKKGDLLVEFDCHQKLANVDMAKADLAGAMEQHEAKIKMQGLKQASDVEVALAASETNRAKAQLKLNLALASECKIYAPWSGRVAKSHVKQHMVVNAGDPLLDIIDTGRLKMKLNVPSVRLPNIAIGQTFHINIEETNQQYSARISAINSLVDPVSQTVEVEALLINPNRALLAGMSGTASIPASASKSQLAYH